MGVIGLGRAGMHHAERLSLRTDFVVSAVHDPSPTGRAAAVPAGAAFHAEWNELLLDPNVDLILVAAPVPARRALAVAALEAGKHVLVESPMGVTADDCERMCSAARRSNRVLSVVEASRPDDDFRTALQTVQTGALGQVVSARLLIWGRGVPDDRREARPEDNGNGDAPPSALVPGSAAAITQLVRLLGDQPARVFARVSPAGRNDAGGEFSLQVQFAGGAVGAIERNRNSYAPVNTGWMLEGTAGGYHGFRRYAPADAGEIFDFPLEPPAADWDDSYDRALRELREGSPVPPSAVEGARVVRILEAAAESSRTGEVANIAPEACAGGEVGEPAKVSASSASLPESCVL